MIFRTAADSDRVYERQKEREREERKRRERSENKNAQQQQPLQQPIASAGA